jgi:hypothetical protein
MYGGARTAYASSETGDKGDYCKKHHEDSIYRRNDNEGISPSAFLSVGCAGTRKVERRKRERLTKPVTS